jgi:ABC-type branched-subunit amino acid transport system ATPase component
MVSVMRKCLYLLVFHFYRKGRFQRKLTEKIYKGFVDDLYSGKRVELAGPDGGVTTLFIKDGFLKVSEERRVSPNRVLAQLKELAVERANTSQEFQDYTVKALTTVPEESVFKAYGNKGQGEIVL